MARADPRRTALVCGERRVSFAELDGAANAVAHACAPHMGAPGDRVAVMLPNGIAGFAVWHGATRAGALVVPVSTRLTAPEATYILEDSGAVLLVHDGSAVASAAARAAGVAALVVDDTVLGEGRADPPTPDYLGTPVVAMTYTSGTTGRPKGIARAAPAPALETPPNPFATFWGFGPSDVHLMCGPMYHTAPSAYALMSLGEGGSVVIMERFDATESLRLVETERVTTAQMVPAHFIRILEADWQHYDRSSVRKVLHAAAPCPVAVKRRIIDVFPPGVVWEYYGASEGMATVISPDEWLAKQGSVGRPFPGLSVRILDEDGTELPAGEVGSIYVSAFAGQRFRYHEAPDKTDRAWRDEYFTVGDLGWLDEDGYLFLADRRTDLITQRGRERLPGGGRGRPHRGPRRGRRGGDRAARRPHGPEGPRRGGAAPRRPARRRGPRRAAVAAPGRLQAAPGRWSSSTSFPESPMAKCSRRNCVRTEWRRRHDRGTRGPGRGAPAHRREARRGQRRAGPSPTSTRPPRRSSVTPPTAPRRTCRRPSPPPAGPSTTRRGPPTTSSGAAACGSCTTPSWPTKRSCGPSPWPRWGAPSPSRTPTRSTCPSTTSTTGWTSRCATSTSVGCPTATSSGRRSGVSCAARPSAWWGPSRRGTSRST